MANVLIVVYLLIVLALIAVILLQRSEGGALGIGGGNANFNTTRSSANILTRTTAVLAALFFATAIGLTIINEVDRGSQSILDSAAGAGGEESTSVLDALNSLQSDDEGLALPDDGATPAEPAAEDAPDLAIPDSGAPADGESTGN